MRSPRARSERGRGTARQTPEYARASVSTSALRAPAFMLEIGMGEAAMILTEGQRVRPRRAVELGYSFRRPDLVPALKSILGGS